MSLLILLPALAQAACEPPADAVAEFQVTPEYVGGFPLMIELRAGDSAERLHDAVKTLDTLSVPATLVMRTEQASEQSEWLFGVVEAGHELALYSTQTELVGAPLPKLSAPWLSAIKAQSRAGKRSSGVRPTAWATDLPLSRAADLAVEQSRLSHVLLDSTDAKPHRVKRIDGTRGTALVLPAPAIGCAGTVSATHWGLDEVSLTLEQLPALRLPVLRLRLEADALGPEQLQILEGWITQVAQPAGIRFLTTSQVTPEIPLSQAPPEATEGRSLPLDTLQQAAAQLYATPLSAKLPATVQGYNLTELFLGLCLHSAAVLKGEEMPQVLRLGLLTAPAESSKSTVPGMVSASEVRLAAADLAPRLRDRIPNLVDVGDKLLAAREMLWAMAWTVAESPAPEDSVEVQLVQDPLPSAPDLGWGASAG
ncbi:MAG: hypothetical protein VX899_16180 [Myxococcota bacterium]|nr:hypothetical protein [Myxococcota bacterium]